jgi:phosphate-selective porin OprO/OprP
VGRLTPVQCFGLRSTLTCPLNSDSAQHQVLHARDYADIGGEFAWIDGPLSFQSEAANTALELKEGSDPDNLWGGYASLSYFLTGEHRNYNPKAGTFGRVKVHDPVNEGGPGAWEIGTRLDYIDLNDGVAQGGQQYSVIAGVNWYLNDYSRIMLDGAVTQVDDAAGDAAAIGSNNTIWGVGTRVQVDW